MVLIMFSTNWVIYYPKGPCTQIVDTLAQKYLYGEYFKGKVYTIWVHGPLGLITLMATLALSATPENELGRHCTSDKEPPA